MVRASRLHREGQGFESLATHHVKTPTSVGVFTCHVIDPISLSILRGREAGNVGVHVADRLVSAAVFTLKKYPQDLWVKSAILKGGG